MDHHTSAASAIVWHHPRIILLRLTCWIHFEIPVTMMQVQPLLNMSYHWKLDCRWQKPHAQKCNMSYQWKLDCRWQKPHKQISRWFNWHCWCRGRFIRSVVETFWFGLQRWSAMRLARSHMQVLPCYELLRGAIRPHLSTAPFRAVSCGGWSESISTTQHSVFRWLCNLPAYIQPALLYALEL